MVCHVWWKAFGAAVLLAGCAGVEAPSGPPVAGTAQGPGSPAIQQLVEQQPHSGNAAFGTARIVGGNGDGTPVIERGGAAAPNSIGDAPKAVNGVPLIGPRSKSGA